MKHSEVISRPPGYWGVAVWDLSLGLYDGGCGGGVSGQATRAARLSVLTNKADGGIAKRKCAAGGKVYLVELPSLIWNATRLVQCEQPGKDIVFGNVRGPSVGGCDGGIQVAVRVRQPSRALIIEIGEGALL